VKRKRTERRPITTFVRFLFSPFVIFVTLWLIPLARPTQKNGRFTLEHAYSTGEWQIKNFYVLLQIAHMILQLMERGSLLGGDCKLMFGCIRNLARRLSESLRNRLIPPEATDPAIARHIQIRLNTS
jgi:hypothetical protein